MAGFVAAIVAAVANLWQLPAQTSPADLAIANRGGSRRTKTVTTLLLVQTAGFRSSCSPVAGLFSPRSFSPANLPHRTSACKWTASCSRTSSRALAARQVRADLR